MVGTGMCRGIGSENWGIPNFCKMFINGCLLPGDSTGLCFFLHMCRKNESFESALKCLHVVWWTHTGMCFEICQEYLGS